MHKLALETSTNAYEVVIKNYGKLFSCLAIHCLFSPQNVALFYAKYYSRICDWSWTAAVPSWSWDDQKVLDYLVS